MTKEEFVRVIEMVLAQDALVDKHSDFIQFDSPFWQFGFIMFDKLIEASFTEEGSDWVSWWLWERPCFDGTYNKAYDKDGKVIPTETIDDLWELVKNHVK